MQFHLPSFVFYNLHSRFQKHPGAGHDFTSNVGLQPRYKSFIYRTYGKARRNSFIYRTYKNTPGGRGARGNKKEEAGTRLKKRALRRNGKEAG